MGEFSKTVSGFYASPNVHLVSSEYWHFLHPNKFPVESFQTTRFKPCFQQSISGFLMAALRECSHFGLRMFHSLNSLTTFAPM